MVIEIGIREPDGEVLRLGRRSSRGRGSSLQSQLISSQSGSESKLAPSEAGV